MNSRLMCMASGSLQKNVLLLEDVCTFTQLLWGPLLFAQSADRSSRQLGQSGLIDKDAIMQFYWPLQHLQCT